MKLQKIFVLLTLLLVSACASGGPREQKITDSNRQEIMNEVMPKLSSEEQKTLLAYAARMMMANMGTAMGNAFSGEKTKSPQALLPTGKSINEMLAEQKAFEAEQH